MTSAFAATDVPRLAQLFSEITVSARLLKEMRKEARDLEIRITTYLEQNEKDGMQVNAQVAVIEKKVTRKRDSGVKLEAWRRILGDFGIAVDAQSEAMMAKLEAVNATVRVEASRLRVEERPVERPT
jgi:hypothetical protein